MAKKVVNFDRFNKFFLIAVIIFMVVFTIRFFTNVSDTKSSSNISPIITTSTEDSFWPYRCIDTMKTSRDKARAWQEKSDLLKHIDWEMKVISEMGANCVAIDTPYDAEFLPYLKKWVSAARAKNLHIWFRGNFSAWEGWFDYPRYMSADQHLQKTEQFIKDNQELFLDGDIFTPSPEAENGGPFNQVEIDEYPAFRKFIVDEYNLSQKTFKEIDKNVIVNYQSMNGGLARRMMDQMTVDQMGKVVSLDHYIKTSPEMSDYINYFKDKFGAKVVIGEWGAPIPDINGQMSEKEQADFTRDLLEEMYRNKNAVTAINYWVLFDSSTALYNADQSPRQVVEVIKNYFSPAKVLGKVVNESGEGLESVQVKIAGTDQVISSNGLGSYQFMVPVSDVKLEFSKENYKTVTKDLSLKNGENLVKDVKMEVINQDLWYSFKLFFDKII